MNKRFRKSLFAACLLLLAGSSVVAGEAEDVTMVKAALQKLLPQTAPDRLSASLIPGLYEAVYGTQVLYISADGKYLIQGDLMDVAKRENITDLARRDGRLKVINAIDPDSMIVFKAEEAKHVVTAFTDIDCSYCRKMHKQMAEYNDLGIEFRYLAYPRSGANTPSYFKAVAVWCSDNKQDALTRSKNGENLDRIKCANPVIDHMAAARAVGVSGTPSLILENGEMIPGYVEPKRLLKMLDNKKI